MVEASVSENVDYMVELIDQVLEFSKLETSAIERDYERIPLSGLLNSIMSSEEIAKRKNLKPQLKVESIADEAIVSKYLYSNIELIRRIVLILVRNAFKFTEEGSVTVVFSEPEESLLKIEVRDTGIGIAEEEIPKIFERFYQVDQYQKGVGLSLSFANKMIALLGGSIHIESELKVGTTVVVMLANTLRNP